MHKTIPPLPSFGIGPFRDDRAPHFRVRPCVHRVLLFAFPLLFMQVGLCQTPPPSHVLPASTSQTAVSKLAPELQAAVSDAVGGTAPGEAIARHVPSTALREGKARVIIGTTGLSDELLLALRAGGVDIVTTHTSAGPAQISALCADPRLLLTIAARSDVRQVILEPLVAPRPPLTPPGGRKLQPLLRKK